MPELPEAETIVRGLRGHLTGRRILNVEVLRSDLLASPAPRFTRALQGRAIEGVGRRGKNVVLELSEGHRLVVNLGMTGKLLLACETDPDARAGSVRVGEDAPSRASVPSHPGVRLTLSQGLTLWYDDIRRFGRLVVMDPAEWRHWSGGLGPEPLSSGFTAAVLRRGLSRSSSPLRSWLLDQRKIAGVGNIYALEALFRSRLHPHRPSRTVDAREAAKLHRDIRQVLRRAIEHRGTTLRDYRDPDGERGENAPRLAVYGRGGRPCPRCRTLIVRIVFSNRSAFLCPTCQPEHEA